MKTTPYFRNRTLRDRPELQKYLKEIADAIDHYHAIEQQADGRTRRWIYISEIDKYIRVIIEPDGETIHNAFQDRTYTRQEKRKDP